MPKAYRKPCSDFFWLEKGRSSDQRITATESGYNNSSRSLREGFSTYQTLLELIENEEYVAKG